MPASPDANAKPEGDAAAPPPAPRKETFLARYPRNFKIGALVILVAAVAAAWLVPGFHGHKAKKIEIATTVSGADTRAAIANPQPAPVQAPAPAQPDAAANPGSAAKDAGDEDANDGTSIFMVPAPDPGLTEDAPQGTLPRIGEDGRQPWQVYARPFNGGDKRPRIAIVVTGLGLERITSDAAIDRLPPNVTLAFDVQSPVVGAWCARARQAGHETLLMLPMEPFDYPRSDPGPNTLLSNLTTADNLQRLKLALAQASGYVGITTLSGSRFTTDPDRIKPVLEVLHKRGLMVFDARIAPHSAIADLARDAQVPVAVETRKLDLNLAPDAIDETFAQMEQTARLTGRAVGMTAASPEMIDRLGPWIKQLKSDGIALAPLSAMVQ